MTEKLSGGHRNTAFPCTEGVRGQWEFFIGGNGRKRYHRCLYSIRYSAAKQLKELWKPRFRYLVLFLLLISPFSTCGHGFPYVEWLFHVQKWVKRVSIEVEHIAFYVGT